MPEKAKVVIDTCTYISVFGSKNERSAPKLLFQKLQQKLFYVVITPFILAEIIKISERRRLLNKREIILFLEEISDNLIILEGNYQTYTLDKIDKDDNIILAAAVESNSDYIVSLDNHILNLKHYRGIQTVSPSAFNKLLENETCKKLETIIFSNYY
jgi:putative PIN family toxin of toxin-antitoxin system